MVGATSPSASSSRVARPEVTARLVRQLARVDEGLAMRIRAYEEKLSTPGTAPELAREMSEAYASAVALLESHREALRKLEAASPFEVDLVLQELRSRVRLAEQRGASRCRTSGSAACTSPTETAWIQMTSPSSGVPKPKRSPSPSR
jgi:hypothetical protein